VALAGGRLVDLPRISMFRSPSCPQLGHLTRPVIVLSGLTSERSVAAPHALHTCAAINGSLASWLMRLTGCGCNQKWLDNTTRRTTELASNMRNSESIYPRRGVPFSFLLALLAWDWSTKMPNTEGYWQSDDYHVH